MSLVSWRRRGDKNDNGERMKGRGNKKRGAEGGKEWAEQDELR